MDLSEDSEHQATLGERTVLGRRTPDAMVRFQWTGAEPEGMDDPELAQQCGAMWEGAELVTYNLQHLRHNYRHWADEFLEDSD